MKTEGGFALAAVLWISALLGLAALLAVAAGRQAVQRVGLAEAAAQARELADAGAMQAGFALAAADAGLAGADAWPTDGTPREVSLGVGTAQVAIRDQSALIDVNLAGEDVLAHLFLSVTGDPVLADHLTESVADWRDLDQLRHANGAEAEDYRRAGKAWGPRDGPFVRVAELQLVMGMTPDIYGQVAPQLTVWGAVPPPVFAIHAVGHAGDSLFVREAVLHLTRNPIQPLQWLDWRQGEAP